MKDSLQKNFIFIIGAPRSGSTWLQNIIGSHPGVASADAELTLFNRYIRPFITQYQIEEKPVIENKWNQGLPFLFKRNEIDEFIKLFLNEAYSKIDRAGATHILDKHPHYSEDVDLINSYIPQSRFINIIRDGREVALSWYKAHQSKGFGARSIKNAAKDWKNFVVNAENAKKFGPERYLEMRYRDILLDPEKSIKQIFTFCLLDYDNEVIQKIIDKNFGESKMVSSPTSGISLVERFEGKEGWSKGMSIRDRVHFDNEAGQLLIQYGFEKSNKWMGNIVSVTFVRILFFFELMWRKIKKSIGALIYG